VHQSAVVYEALLLLLLLVVVVVGISCHAAICIDAYTSYAVNADAPLPCLQFMLLIFISSVANCTISQSQPSIGHQVWIRAAS